MTNRNQVELAQVIALEAHAGQVDKAGRPYIEHPAAVAHALRMESFSIQAVAWLHDVLEDSKFTADDLLALGVEKAIVRAVECITRQPGEPVEAYYERVKQSGWALVVKAADIDHNTRVERLARLDDATIVRLVRKYAKARRLLGLLPEEDFGPRMRGRRR